MYSTCFSEESAGYCGRTCATFFVLLRLSPACLNEEDDEAAREAFDDTRWGIFGPGPLRDDVEGNDRKDVCRLMPLILVLVALVEGR